MSTSETILQRSMETTNSYHNAEGSYQEYSGVGKSMDSLQTGIPFGEPSTLIYAVTSKVDKVTVVYNSLKEKRKKERMAFNRGE